MGLCSPERESFPLSSVGPWGDRPGCEVFSFSVVPGSTAMVGGSMMRGDGSFLLSCSLSYHLVHRAADSHLRRDRPMSSPWPIALTFGGRTCNGGQARCFSSVSRPGRGGNPALRRLTLSAWTS